MKDKDTKLLEEAYNKINEANPSYPIPDVVGGLATGDYSPMNLLGNLTREEIDYIKAFLAGEVDLHSNESLVMKLYDYFKDEMPYGTQKARTGDPEEWFYDRLTQMFNKQKKLGM